MNRRPFALVALVLLALAACAGAETDISAAQLATETTPTPSLATATQAVPAVTPTVSPTPAGPLDVVVWWPEALAPLDNETAAELLSEQLSAFQRENDDVAVEFRLKRVEDVGGIMSTLRTGSAVAPGALPDLTLLQRDDLLIAVEAGLVQPLDARLSPALLEDIQEIGLALGTVDGQLYGLPYTLEIEHVATLPETPEVDRWRLDRLLAEDIPFIFAAGRTTGINDVLLLQYLSAGGALSETGSLVMDADALESTLNFYERAAEQGIVDPIVLEYVQVSDYTDLLLDGSRGAAVVNSSLYLALADQGVRLGVAPVPTIDGLPRTIANGWMWVLTTSDAERQARALRFLTWMLDAGRQADYARVVHMLPSQRTALRQQTDPAYAAFASDLLASAVLPLTESESGAAARAIQNAFVAVLTGQRTAEAAARDVMEQFNE